MPSRSCGTQSGWPARYRCKTVFAGRGGNARGPRRENSFSPLYGDGLWLAVIWMPPAAPVCRTSTPVVGVAAMPASIVARPTACKPAVDGPGQHSARGPAVAAEHDRPGGGHGRKRRRIADGHLRRQGFAHDAPQSGNADDRFAHDILASLLPFEPELRLYVGVRRLLPDNDRPLMRLPDRFPNSALPTRVRIAHGGCHGFRRSTATAVMGHLRTMPSPTDTSTQPLLQLECGRRGKLSPAAVENIRTWLTAPYLAEYAPRWPNTSPPARWKELDDVFWTTIPFGTGGRRGRMYPIGTNAINDRTIGESAQGLADYVQGQSSRAGRRGKPLSCAIAYDTRHRSREFAELCARSWPRPASRSTSSTATAARPKLSFTVRYKHCDCGIMITASHNPPTDNAVKVYWSTGGQLLPPHDENVIDRVQKVNEIKRMPFAEGLAHGPDRLLPGGGRCGVHRGRAAAELARPAQPEDHLFAAARRGRVGRLPGAGRRRLSRRRGLRPARRARRRFHQRAEPRRQSGESGRLRRDDRPRPARSAPT